MLLGRLNCGFLLSQVGTVEIRQVFEHEDFGAEFTPELREQEERLRAQIVEKK